MPTTIRVLVVDDHHLVRAAIIAILNNFEGITCVGEATHGREALLQIPHQQPDLVLLDMEMPVMSGWETLSRIVTEHSHVRVVAFSMYSEAAHVLRALHLGASGYIAKTASPQELETVVRASMRGELACSQEIQELLKQNTEQGNPSSGELPLRLSSDKLAYASLTPRQRQILRLLADSHSSKKIAALLGVKVRTVNSHRGLLMKRLGIHNTAGLVRYAIRQGVLTQEVPVIATYHNQDAQALRLDG